MKQQVAIERDEHRVVVTVECDGIYAAIKLFEELCQAARLGRMVLEVEVDVKHPNAG